MADSKRPGLTGAPVGRRTFSTAFRGFDQEEVRAYLEALAFEFRELRDRITELEGELEVARARPAAAAGAKLDVIGITNALGEETARVLRTAQEAADDLRARAEEGSARTLHEAHEEASRVRTAAESVLAERTTEAEAAATKIRTDAEAATTTVRSEAATEAASTVAKAIEQGRDMLSQAQAARERVLSDLARRRKVGLSQLEQLRAGRERLNTSLLGARAELDRIVDDLARSDEEARLAEEAVGPAPARTGPPDEAEEAAPAGEDATTVSVPDDATVTEAATEEVGAVDAGAAAPTSATTGTTDAVTTAPTGKASAKKATSSSAPAPAPAAAETTPADADPPQRTGGDAEAAPAAAGSRSAKSGAREPYRHDRVPAGLLPTEAVGGPADEERPSGRVDELFARIRADRAQKVTDARAVLADEPEEADAEEADVAAAVGVADAVGAADAGPEGAPAPPAGPRDEPGLEAPRSDADESYLQRRDALLDKPMASLQRAVKRGLADEQNVALERLRTSRTTVTVDLLFGTETEHRERAAAWVASGLASAAGAGSRLGGGSGAPVADRHLAPSRERLGQQLTAPVRHRTAELLTSVGDDHGSDTADRINSIYREARARIDRLVGDAVTEAASSGFSAAVAEGTPVRWVVDDADGPCPDCDDNALAGPTPLGQQFPTGQLAPPAHPGCRCVLAPSPT